MVCISAVTNGPVSPSSRMLSDTAPEMVSALQPKVRCSGTSSTLGAARTPTPIRITVNAMATTIHA